jgi:hypothetical protein
MQNNIQQEIEESVLNFIDNLSWELSERESNPVQLNEWHKKVLARHVGSLIRNIQGKMYTNLSEFIRNTDKATFNVERNKIVS